MCHQRGPHLTGVRVERDLHLAPHAALRIAMLTDLPFAFAVDLHARAVDHQMNRVAVANDRQLYIKGLCAATQRRVVRYWQGGEGQITQALRKALQGAQWQAKHGLQAEQGLNRCIAIQLRTTAHRLDVGHARKGGFVDPHRDVTPVDQAGVVRRPVFDAVARLRLVCPAHVPAHLLGKNRESTQEPELLTKASPRSLRVNVTATRLDLCNNAVGQRRPRQSTKNRFFVTGTCLTARIAASPVACLARPIGAPCLLHAPKGSPLEGQPTTQARKPAISATTPTPTLTYPPRMRPHPKTHLSPHPGRVSNRRTTTAPMRRANESNESNESNRGRRRR